MFSINDKINERAKVWNDAKKFLDEHRNADGKISNEDLNVYNRMQDDIINLGKEIDAMQKDAEIEAKLNEATSKPLVGSVVDKAEKTGRASKEYHEAFMAMLRGRSFSNNVLSTTPGSEGGFLIPTEFDKQIVVDLYQQNIMRQLCNVIQTAADHKIPLSATHSTAAWTAENGSYSESDPTFAQKTLEAFKLTDLVKVSEELMQDSMFNLESYISYEFTRAFSCKEEEAFCVGDGSSKPTGLFTANGGSVGVTTASATAITGDNLIDLIYSLKSPYRKNAAFLMNDATVAEVRKLKDGQGRYLWQPAMMSGQPDTICGYAVHTSAYVPTIAANAYTVAFGDFKNYWIADRGSRNMKRLNELYATNGQVGFVCTERVDGKIILAEGIKLIKQHA